MRGEGAGREVETPIEIGVLGFWGTRLGQTGLGGTTRDSVRSRGQKRMKGSKEDRRKKEGKKGKKE